MAQESNLVLWEKGEDPSEECLEPQQQVDFLDPCVKQVRVIIDELRHRWMQHNDMVFADMQEKTKASHIDLAASPEIQSGEIQWVTAA